MHDIRHIIIHRHPHTIGSVAASLTAFLAIASGSFIVNAFHLATLIVYGPILLHRRHRVEHALGLVVLLSAAQALNWIIPAWHSLSSPAIAIVTLIFTSSLTAAITVSVLLVHTSLRSRIPSPLSQVLLFPVLWSATWLGVSLLSPVGRLTSWIPVYHSPGYQWLVPFTGPMVNDWLVSAWAVVLSQVAEHLIMGTRTDEEEPFLSGRASEDLRQQPHNFKTITTFSVFLVALQFPSFYFTDTLLPVMSSETVPLTVSCILPPRHPNSDLTLGDYITESSHHWGFADVLLWPEGALRFNGESERNETFSGLIGKLQNTTTALLGVPFIDTTSAVADPSGKKLEHRNGIALLSRYSEEPHLIYYKRNLVPVAESFGLTHSTEPPSIITHPVRLGKKEVWSLPITTSICLDFAMPNPFSDLTSRPALVLAPAMTWDKSIGRVMWDQAIQRAHELGSTILWCDGGDEGLSGVGGNGFHEPQQIGQGSWNRVIGIPYPLKESRTLYGRFGNGFFISLTVIGLFAFEAASRVAAPLVRFIRRNKANPASLITFDE